MAKDRWGYALLYDVEASMKIALKDGWGPSKPGWTARQQAAAAVEEDFRYLKRWVDDDWSWVGYVAKVDGKEVDSCWGFEDPLYATEEATRAAEGHIDRMEIVERETELAACYP